MILQRLCDLYDRLSSDPRVDIALQGFAPQKICFELVIDRDGTLVAIHDIREAEGKKLRPRMMHLPIGSGGNRTSGVKAMFLWDKAEYLLGLVPREIREAPVGESESERAKREKKVARVAECFESFQALHLEAVRRIDDVAYQAFCRFLERWSPEQLDESQLTMLDEMGIASGVVRLQGERQFLHDLPTVKQYWTDRQAEEAGNAQVGTCLVTGHAAPLERTHPAIKGVRDAQSSGASIVSFNQSAFKSFGKDQGLNSPVSVSAAFKYTTALNYLLDRRNRRRLQVGDATCVFWADEPSGVAEDLFGFGLDPMAYEDRDRAKEIGNRLQQAVRGEGVLPDRGVGFHVLGLSPNMSRLSIRLWIAGPAIELIERVVAHQRRLEITRGPKDPEWISLRMILEHTVRESKDISPVLAGSLLRSVLTAAPYPDSLLATIVRRIRAGRDVSYVKAAVIKAMLNHNHQKEVTSMLDDQRPECAYHLGRLFACIERAQEDALPGINATIKDRFFGAASATPATVFPRLIRMNQHHVGKLEGGRKVVAERRIQEIFSRIGAFPSHLGLVDQGLFAIGYYHQRQEFFRKRADPPEKS